LFASHVSKDGHSGVEVLVDEIELIQIWVVAALDSIVETLGVFKEHLFEADGLLGFKAFLFFFLLLFDELSHIVRMNKLASVTVWAMT
jgi:hypothetical protein